MSPRPANDSQWLAILWRDHLAFGEEDVFAALGLSVPRPADGDVRAIGSNSWTAANEAVRHLRGAVQAGFRSVSTLEAKVGCSWERGQMSEESRMMLGTKRSAASPSSRPGSAGATKRWTK